MSSGEVAVTTPFSGLPGRVEAGNSEQQQQQDVSTEQQEQLMDGNLHSTPQRSPSNVQEKKDPDNHTDQQQQKYAGELHGGCEDQQHQSQLEKYEQQEERSSHKESLQGTGRHEQQHTQEEVREGTDVIYSAQMLEGSDTIFPTQQPQGHEKDRKPSLPRGGFCRGRPRRVASVRFNVPPSPSGSDANPDVIAITPINLADTHAEATRQSFSASEASDGTIITSSDRRSPPGLSRLSVRTSTAAAAAAGDGDERIAVPTREALGGTAAHTEEAETDVSVALATDANHGGRMVEQAPGARATDEHVDEDAIWRTAEDKRSPLCCPGSSEKEHAVPHVVSVGHYTVEQLANISLAATSSAQSRAKNHKYGSLSASQRERFDAEDVAGVSRSDDAEIYITRGANSDTSDIAARGDEGPAICGRADADCSKRPFYASAAAAAAPSLAARGLYVEKAVGNDDVPAASTETIYASIAKRSATDATAVCSRNGECDHGGILIHERDFSKRNNMNTTRCSREYQSGTSGGYSDQCDGDDDPGHVNAKTSHNGPQLCAYTQEGGSAAALLKRRSGLPQQQSRKPLQALSVGSTSISSTVGNGIYSTDDSVAPTDAAAAAVCATAVGAALAVDAVAAYSCPPTRDICSAGENNAAALRLGTAHILVSSMGVDGAKKFAATGEASASPATCDRKSASNTCTVIASIESPSASFITPGHRKGDASTKQRPHIETGCPILTHTKRSLICETGSRSPTHANRLPIETEWHSPPDATSAETPAEDALEYGSDWSAFRRATGRCSVVNPGAVVSFMKTASGVWRYAGKSVGDASSSTTTARSRISDSILMKPSTGGTLPRPAATTDTLSTQHQQRIREWDTPSSSMRRSYYLNAAAVNAAAAADAAAHSTGERDSAASRRDRQRAISAGAMVFANGQHKPPSFTGPLHDSGLSSARRGVSGGSDIQTTTRPVHITESTNVQSPSSCEADLAETKTVCGNTGTTTRRQLLSWWWKRNNTEEQQQQQPLQRLAHEQSQIHSVQDRRQHSLQQESQQQDHEMLPLRAKHPPQLCFPLGTAASVRTSDKAADENADAGLNGKTTDLERLLGAELDSDIREKISREALQKEDLEAIICNIQQVKSFLVEKLRECEAALLATAIERDEKEAALKELNGSLQEREAQRDATVKQLEAESAEKTKEVERLQEEITRLLEREGDQQQQIQQLQDEAVLLRADVHDRVAANALEQESLVATIRQLETDKDSLEEQVQQLQQALAKSRQQLAGALARVDELEAFAPPPLCAETSQQSPSNKSSCSSGQCSNSASPAASSASNIVVDSLRPTWWGGSSSTSETPKMQPAQQRQRPKRPQPQQNSPSPSTQPNVETPSHKKTNNKCTDDCSKSTPQHSQGSSSSEKTPISLEGCGQSERRSTASSSSFTLPPAGALFTPSGIASNTKQQQQHLHPKPQQPKQQNETPEVSQQQQQQQQQRSRQKKSHSQQQLSSEQQRNVITKEKPPLASESSGPQSPSAASAKKEDFSADCTSASSSIRNSNAVEECQETNIKEEHGKGIYAAASTTSPAQQSPAGATAESDTAAVTGTTTAAGRGGGGAGATVQRETDSSRQAAATVAAGGVALTDAATGTETVEKIREAFTGGVTRVLQQLENVLTVEDRLLISESGIYTEDGVCLHNYDGGSALSGAGLSPGVTTENHCQAPKTAQLKTRRRSDQQTKQQQQRGKSSSKQREPATESVQTSSGRRRSQLLSLPQGSSSPQAKILTGGDVYSSDWKSQSNSNMRNSQSQRSSVSDSSEREKSLRQPEKSDESLPNRPPASASTGEDLVVVLSSEVEGDQTSKRITKNNFPSSTSKGRAPQRSATITITGGSAGGSHPQQQSSTHVISSAPASPSGPPSTPVSRGTTASSVGGSVRDAVCSVLQAVHHRAVEVYIHPSSVLSAAGNATCTVSGGCLSVSKGSGSSATSSTARTNASGGDLSDAASLRQHQQLQQQHSGNSGQQSKNGRVRSSAWEHLLQLHRDAQQMPLFGSTPYPAANMSTTNTYRQASSNASTAIHHVINSAAAVAVAVTGGDSTHMRYINKSSTASGHIMGDSAAAAAEAAGDITASSRDDNSNTNGNDSNQPNTSGEVSGNLKRRVSQEGKSCGMEDASATKRSTATHALVQQQGTQQRQDQQQEHHKNIVVDNKEGRGVRGASPQEASVLSSHQQQLKREGEAEEEQVLTLLKEHAVNAEVVTNVATSTAYEKKSYGKEGTSTQHDTCEHPHFGSNGQEEPSQDDTDTMQQQQQRDRTNKTAEAVLEEKNHRSEDAQRELKQQQKQGDIQQGEMANGDLVSTILARFEGVDQLSDRHVRRTHQSEQSQGDSINRDSSEVGPLQEGNNTQRQVIQRRNETPDRPVEVDNTPAEANTHGGANIQVGTKVHRGSSRGESQYRERETSIEEKERQQDTRIKEEEKLLSDGNEEAQIKEEFQQQCVTERVTPPNRCDTAQQKDLDPCSVQDIHNNVERDKNYSTEQRKDMVTDDPVTMQEHLQKKKNKHTQRPKRGMQNNPPDIEMQQSSVSPLSQSSSDIATPVAAAAAEEQTKEIHTEQQQQQHVKMSSDKHNSDEEAEKKKKISHTSQESSQWQKEKIMTYDIAAQGRLQSNEEGELQHKAHEMEPSPQSTKERASPAEATQEQPLLHTIKEKTLQHESSPDQSLLLEKEKVVMQHETSQELLKSNKEQTTQDEIAQEPLESEVTQRQQQQQQQPKQQQPQQHQQQPMQKKTAQSRGKQQKGHHRKGGGSGKNTGKQRRKS